MESTTCVSHKEFWERKVDWFVRMWQYGRHDDVTFTKNMQLMGYDEEAVQDCLEEYNNED